MILKCHAKNEPKRSAFLEIFYVKDSRNLNGRENFGAKSPQPGCLSV